MCAQGWLQAHPLHPRTDDGNPVLDADCVCDGVCDLARVSDCVADCDCVAVTVCDWLGVLERVSPSV